MNIEELNNQGNISSPPQFYDTKSSVSSEKAQRYEEEYDLPDDEYVKWLHEAHPESVTTETAAANENDTLNQSNNDDKIPTEKRS